MVAIFYGCPKEIRGEKKVLYAFYKRLKKKDS